MKAICGIDVGGTAVKIGIFDLDMNLIEKYQIKTIEVNFEPTLKNKIDYHTKKLKLTSPISGESTLSTTANKKIK